MELEINGYKILCDVSTGVVRPFVPESLRRQAFDVIHGAPHPSTISHQLKEKFIWPGKKKDAILCA